MCPCEPPTKSVLNDDDCAKAFRVTTPFDATLTKSSVYDEAVPNVIDWASGSVASKVNIGAELALNSAIVWLPLDIDGSVLGKNIASKKSIILPLVPALNDDV